MRKARENHRGDVRENECEGDVSQDLVRPSTASPVSLLNMPASGPA